MYQRESLGIEEAKAAIEAILGEALKKPAQPVAVAVVDNRGELISYARMDGANQFNETMSLRKARTAALVGIDTSVFGQALPSLKINITDFGGCDVTIVPGGVSVSKPGGGPLVGAIGVSGRMAEEDEILARVGLNTLRSANSSA
jgi:glc operon protein GlcG